MCIRQYSKNTQQPALQEGNESTNRRVRTLSTDRRNAERTSAEMEQQAEQMFRSLVSAFSKQENITERLKAHRPMEWVQKTNSIRNRAVEIVNNEWIYI